MNTEHNEKTPQLPNGLRIAISIGTLVAVLVAFNQCTLEKKTTNKRSTASTSSAPSTATGDSSDIENDSDLPDGLVMPPMNSPTEDSELDTIDVGVKNFEQIYLSMASVTGVSPTTTAVQNLYREIIVQLPADNNVKSFLPANQVAITKLAAEFCEVLVETANLRSAVWPTINFGQTPTQAFSGANANNKSLVISQAIDRFMPPMDSQSRVIVVNELSRLFDELLTGENQSTSVTTRKVIKGMCISTLASAQSTLL